MAHMPIDETNQFTGDQRAPREEKREVHEIRISNTLDANSHGWNVASTILACASLVALAWWLSTAGLLELAASLVAAFFFQFVALLLRNGVIVIPDRRSEDARIEEGKSAIRAIVGMGQAFLDRSSILRLAVVAMGYAVMFILARAGIQLALGLFSNIWLAAAAGAAVASLICAPTLFAGLFRSLKSKTKAAR